MTDKEYLKDIIAGEIYSLILKADAKLPLEKRYLVVEFGEDGKIEKISVKDREKKGARVLSVDAGGIDKGKYLLMKIRDALDDAELDIDMKYWELVANAYDWAFYGGEDEEQ